MYDTVIIGAGMSGLAAGIRLAQYDQKVCILEKHQVVGGLNSFYRQHGRNYDVGLHAMTNYTPKGTKTGPLSRLLRHLRMSWDEFSLVQQKSSLISFPGISLEFSNKFQLLENEIREKFPSQIDGFRQMVTGLADYSDLGNINGNLSARTYVSQFLTDPLLINMIFCPVFYYGGAREHDMDFGQFCVMFRSIFLEGFARPYEGVRHILVKLLKRFRSLGGELRLETGVSKIIWADGKVEKMLLDDGTEIQARQYVSSAGWPETMNLCDLQESKKECPAGQLGFIESISVLDCDPKKLGHDKTIVFFNDSERFSYERPNSLADYRSGVICSPNNFEYDKPLGVGMIRITTLASYKEWKKLSKEQYRLEKLKCYDKTLASAVRFVPDFRSRIIDNDMFTPLTVQRFTGRVNGAIYGTQQKKYDGQTPLKNLFVCGTDQGMVGIVGALVSGITVVNRYILS
ncbi:MAG: NAD(P)/FAD-dependent oxidoreductase, partial [Thermoguttaceae bacterium]|nr:NAD(P)/FAD-dependent oxidoreductase [Thermoguttaceae bacterium]